ncbi:MAG: phytanoyl-CoA dioxygenase family protein, partial [Planctomycetes bacterium]|nr:phytanoyl-CoA dioxygenase family protein [Planctomycetota bacterium]
PTRLGSLAVLEGSHRLGFQEHVPTIGAGGSGVRTEHLALRWIGGDFRLGDALLFHSHTIHAALDNQSVDRLRISLDYRYQRVDTDIDPSSMEPHGG